MLRSLPTPFPEVKLIQTEKIQDERGFFQRLYCFNDLSIVGIQKSIKQINSSFNKEAYTLRGMHYQAPPHEEIKIVSVTNGSIFDQIIDVRPSSPTFGQTFSSVLSKDNGLLLIVPEGFAHGFLTLEKETTLLYFVTEFYSKDSERGVRWDDPYFQLKWPHAPQVISKKDREIPNFNLK